LPPAESSMEALKKKKNEARQKQRLKKAPPKSKGNNGTVIINILFNSSDLNANYTFNLNPVLSMKCIKSHFKII